MARKIQKQEPVWCWEIYQSGGKTAIMPVMLPESCRGLDAMSVCLPQGSYTTFRTYKFHYALRLDDHLQRLGSSAELSGKKIELSLDMLRQGLRLAIAAAASQSGRDSELRLRLTLDLADHPGKVFISAEELHTPEKKAYSEGVKVVTSRIQRLMPAAKLTGFISEARKERQSLPLDAYEAVMVDEAGRIREGLSSNFFAVWKSDLWTAGEGVLPGVTRSLVLECTRRMNIQVRLDAIKVEQIAAIQEAFITSSSRGVVPVVQVDDIIVGDGRPGEMTRRISAHFERLIEEKMEPV